MSWLFIDTHAPGEARFAFLEAGKAPAVTSVPGRTVNVLPSLSKKLAKHKVQGICVVAGPGSFSSVRAGVLEANLMARLLKLPLVGITVDEAADLERLSLKLCSKETPPLRSDYVAPLYDKEPNITIPKQPA